MGRPAISDVAALAGVSRTTVSHVLSGKRPVSDAVIRRVREAMSELGYVPRRAAQSLKIGASQVMGLIVPDIGNSFFAELAKSVENAALQSGYNVILGNTAFEAERERFHLHMIRSRAVDGVIYAAGAPPSDQDTSELLEGVPFVLVDEELPGVGAGSVVSDNDQGGRLAARHLAELGHRHALVISASGELMSSVRRVDAFARHWAAAGGTCEVRLGGFTLEGGHQTVRQASELFLDRGVTCVFAANDMMAFGAVTALRELGLNVPSNVSVIGFDDVLAAQLSSPTLTTVRQDAAVLGRRAVEELHRSMAEPGRSPEHMTLAVELIERDSTAPVAEHRRKERGA